MEGQGFNICGADDLSWSKGGTCVGKPMDADWKGVEGF